MNAQVFGTGTDFDILTYWVAAGIILYFAVLPLLPSVIAGWRYGKRMLGISAPLGLLYGFLTAIGLAAIVTPWAYLPGMIWFLGVAPPVVAIAGPAIIYRYCRYRASRRYTSKPTPES